MPRGVTNFVLTNAGKYRSETNDCTVRAMTLATELPYEDIHTLFELAGREHRGRFFTEKGLPLLHTFYPKIIVTKLNIPWLQLTLATFKKQNPKGTFILESIDHAFCIKDGIVHDEWSVGGKTRLESAWKIEV